MPKALNIRQVLSGTEDLVFAAGAGGMCRVCLDHPPQESYKYHFKRRESIYETQ